MDVWTIVLSIIGVAIGSIAGVALYVAKIKTAFKEISDVFEKASLVLEDGKITKDECLDLLNELTEAWDAVKDIFKK